MQKTLYAEPALSRLSGHGRILIKISAATRSAILACARGHAARTPPQEMAGVIRHGKFVPMQNIAADPARHFAIDASVLEDDGVAAIVHSHPGGPPCPSAEDMAQQQATALPWFIAVVRDEKNPGCAEEVFCFDDTPRLTLDEGYRHGVRDCYSLIRGFYAEKRGVILPDYPRGWGWWHDGLDLYEKFFASAGFRLLEIDEQKNPGDVFLAAIRSPTANHGGVLLEGGLILHHLAGNHPADAARLPRKEPLGRWHKHITHWLRYDGAPPVRRFENTEAKTKCKK